MGSVEGCPAPRFVCAVALEIGCGRGVGLGRGGSHGAGAGAAWGPGAGEARSRHLAPGGPDLGRLCPSALFRGARKPMLHHMVAPCLPLVGGVWALRLSWAVSC